MTNTRMDMTKYEDLGEALVNMDILGWTPEYAAEQMGIPEEHIRFFAGLGPKKVYWSPRTPDDRANLEKVIDRLGVVKAASEVGVTRQSLYLWRKGADWDDDKNRRIADLARVL
jgi:hypothetical protein